MTPAVLALVESVERADKAATGGPWRHEHDWTHELYDGAGQLIGKFVAGPHPTDRSADASAMVVLRTAAPALAATVREMAEKLDAMLATHARDTKARLDAEAEVARLRVMVGRLVDAFGPIATMNDDDLVVEEAIGLLASLAALSPDPKETNR